MELLTSQLWDLETTGVFDAGGGQLVAGFEREQQARAAAEWLRASRPVNSAGGILFVSVEPAPTADQLAVNADAETVTISTGTDAGTGTTGAERRVDVTIRAGGTFGHGGHQTTKLAAELLLERLTPGQRVLDIGTGSGILAIAAAKAGASHVVGMDNDPLAVTVATENGLANNVAADFGSWTVAEAAAVLGGPANLLVINVLLPVHRELATQVLGAMTLESSSSSVLVTTGYLDEQAEEVVSLYAGKLSVITERRRDQWSAHVFAVRD